MAQVFWVPMPNNRQFRLGLAKGAAGEEEIRSVRRFHRLPRLLYVPLVWKDGEKDLWFSTAHVGESLGDRAANIPTAYTSYPDRHELLNARNGALTGTDCVMPLDLVYEEAEAVSESRIPRLWRVITFSHPQVKIRLSGYNEEHMGSKASIMIIPQVYLGWCHDLQKNSTPLQKTSHSIEEWPGVWHVGDRATLSSYQIQTIDGIAQRLWTMYFANQPRSLVPLEDVVSATTSIPWRMPQGRQARIEV